MLENLLFLQKLSKNTKIYLFKKKKIIWAKQNCPVHFIQEWDRTYQQDNNPHHGITQTSNISQIITGTHEG